MATLSAIPYADGHVIDRTLLASTTQTTSDVAAGYLPVQGFTQAVLQLSVTAASGTSPTLDLYLQKRLPDGATYTDLAHFTQATTTGNWYVSMVTGANAAAAAQDAALAAASVASIDFQGAWRLKWVIGGTSPSFTFAVYCSLY